MLQLPPHVRGQIMRAFCVEIIPSWLQAQKFHVSSIPYWQRYIQHVVTTHERPPHALDMEWINEMYDLQPGLCGDEPLAQFLYEVETLNELAYEVPTRKVLVAFQQSVAHAGFRLSTLPPHQDWQRICLRDLRTHLASWIQPK